MPTHNDATQTITPVTLDCQICENKTNDLVYVGGLGDLCEHCLNAFTVQCVDCSETIPSTEGYSNATDDNIRCERCHDNFIESRDSHESGQPDERGYFTGNGSQYMSDDDGKYITSKRIFSAEIETYYPSDSALWDVFKEIPQGIGMTHDGSLREQGIEFQTPKLKGRQGEETIMRLCSSLVKNGFTVDHSTGLHLHIDGRSLLPRLRTLELPYSLKNLLGFYLVFEDVLLSFLPHSRRRNRYAEQIGTKYHLSEIREARNVQELEKLWYRERSRVNIKRRKTEKYDSSRYTGVNLHSLFKDGHLEIRYHSGTINSVKILEWVALHLAIIDGAIHDKKRSTPSMERYKKYSPMDTERAYNILSIEEKTKFFFDLLDLPLRSRAYWKERQNTFIKMSNKNEAHSLNEICVE